MQYRTLGNTGEKVSAIGLGCMGMAFAYGQRDDAESRATLELALDLGVNFWDTADMYGQGLSRAPAIRSARHPPQRRIPRYQIRLPLPRR